MIQFNAPAACLGHEVELVPIGSLLRIHRANRCRRTGCVSVADALRSAARRISIKTGYPDGAQK